MLGLLPLLQLNVARACIPVVLAQDAAGPTADNRMRNGAFCLAIGAPPPSQIRKVLMRCEVKSTRAIVQPDHLGADLPAGRLC